MDDVVVVAVLSDELQGVCLDEGERVPGLWLEVNAHDLVEACTVIANCCPTSTTKEVKEPRHVDPTARAGHRYIPSSAGRLAAQPVQQYASIGLSSYGVSSSSRRTRYQPGCRQSELAEDICSVAPCWSIRSNTLSRSR